MAEFYVGQKVVCVDDTRRKNDNGEAHPALNAVYTIREIFPSPVDGVLGLRLVEIVNDPRKYSGHITECGWLLHRFRPLDSKAISIFRQIAKDVTEGRKVDLREPVKARVVEHSISTPGAIK